MKFKLGRKRPLTRGYRLKMKSYLWGAGFVGAPKTCDYSVKAKDSLSRMYMNDKLGDCVIAGMAHVQGVLMDNAENIGQPFIFSDHRIEDLYSAIGGYKPGNPSTDNGCDEVTALNFWREHGLLPGDQNPHKIDNWLAVDATNIQECQATLYLFENLIFGVEMPNAWIDPAPEAPGFVWDVAGPPVPENGHCFVATGYDQDSFTIATWGMLGKITNAALRKYAAKGVGELYVVLSEDSINRARQKAPNGMAWRSLIEDFQNVG